jgi:hypothetical protein
MKFLAESYNESIPSSRHFLAKAPIIGGSRPVSFHPTVKTPIGAPFKPH